ADAITDGQYVAVILSILPKEGRRARRLLPNEPGLPIQDRCTTRRVRRINPVRQDNEPGAGRLGVTLKLLVPRRGGVVRPVGVGGLGGTGCDQDDCKEQRSNYSSD